MNDLGQMFERQAAWQRSRSKLPWAEKLRLSVIMREAMYAIRRSEETRTTNTEKVKGQDFAKPDGEEKTN